MMKAWLVAKKFGDGSIEGVVFTDKGDAMSALEGCDEGSTLATEFCYAGEPDLEMTEIDV